MLPYIDLHCDTLMAATLQGKKDIVHFPEAMLDVERLHKGGCSKQFFAIYMLPKDEMPMSDEAYIAALAEIFENSKPYFGHLTGYLTLEDGRAVEGKMENLDRFYDLGVRLISLTWNFENCFGWPNSKDSEIMNRGLKDFGREAVAYMQELGMLVDVSHLSDGGFWDVAQLCKKPFVASHSNCRALNPHSRSMTDDMIRALADHGGVMGVNFAPEFLTPDVSNRISRVADMVRHVQHMVQVGGMDIAAIGSDLDGIEGQLEIGSPDKMPLLFRELEKAGFHEADLEKIAWKNAQRVMDEAMKA